MPSAPAARALPLVLLLVACGHARTDTRATEVQGPQQAAVPRVTSPEPRGEFDADEAGPGRTGATAQVITFGGDDADPEPPTQIRSAPQRPPIPSFRLFGTRAGDGP